MNAATSPKNLWPLAIIAYFVLFISFIVGFTTWSLRQNMDLVRQDYYEEEVRFQRQMEKVSRTKLLQTAVTVACNPTGHYLEVRLPLAHASQNAVGRIHLYRPSDAALDQDLPLALDAEGKQRVESSQLRAGLWKVRLDWTVNGQDYHHEQSLTLN